MRRNMWTHSHWHGSVPLRLTQTWLTWMSVCGVPQLRSSNCLRIGTRLTGSKIVVEYNSFRSSLIANLEAKQLQRTKCSYYFRKNEASPTRWQVMSQFEIMRKQSHVPIRSGFALNVRACYQLTRTLSTTYLGGKQPFHVYSACFKVRVTERQKVSTSIIGRFFQRRTSFSTRLDYKVAENPY